MATPEEIRDEALRARSVRILVDFTSSVIMQSAMRRSEAEALVDAVRRKILELFPGRDETYELLYAPRFRRLLDEFTDPRPNEPGAVVLRFPGRNGSPQRG